MLPLIIILLLVFEFGGGYYGHSRWGYRGAEASGSAPYCSFSWWPTWLGFATRPRRNSRAASILR
jgi:hypothetical protein